MKGKAGRRKKDPPITLAPLGFEDAVKALLKVKPPKKGRGHGKKKG